MLTLVAGPAGGGKSQLVAELLEAGEIDIAADTTAIWAAVGGHERGPDGKYPVRDETDPALHTARYLQATAAAFALREGFRVAVTTSRRDQAPRWAELASKHDSDFSIRTVDPGRDVVVARLIDPATGELSADCEQAIGRWYT